MRIFISLICTIAVAMIVLDLQGQVKLFLTDGGEPQGAKMISVNTQEESGVAQFFAKAKDATLFVFGIEPSEPEVSELQKLMERRRRETAKVDHWGLMQH